MRRWIKIFARLLQRSGAKRRPAGQSVLGTIAITMVRNEQDIIEPFLRHNAALVDLLVVLDNCSTDATRRIAVEVARELGNIVITDIPDRGYNQSEIITRCLQSVQSATFAEFVFFLDADEFIGCADRDALRGCVEAISQGAMGLLPWMTFVPDPALSEAESPDPLDRLTFRRKQEDPQYYKAVVRMAGAVDPMIKVDQGSHLVRDWRGDVLSSQVLNTLPLLHFPLRSTEHLAAKGVIGWLASNSRTSTRGNINPAYQWKRLHDLVEAGQRPSPADLAMEALAYAQTPQSSDFAVRATPAAHGIKVARRYSDGRFASAKRLIDDAEKRSADIEKPFLLPAPPLLDRTSEQPADASGGALLWGSAFLDMPPIRFAIDRFAPRSILDLGCANGLYPALYQHFGVEDILGVDEIAPQDTVLSSQSYQQEIGRAHV